MDTGQRLPRSICQGVDTTECGWIAAVYRRVVGKQYVFSLLLPHGEQREGYEKTILPNPDIVITITNRVSVLD